MDGQIREIGIRCLKVILCNERSKGKRVKKDTRVLVVFYNGMEGEYPTYMRLAKSLRPL